MSIDWNQDEIEARVRRGAFAGVIRGIGLVDQELTRLVMRTTKSGRKYRRRGVVHQASAPGESWANDTGRLLASKTIEPDEARLRALLVLRTKYAMALEKGTKRMEPRPTAVPALVNMRDQVNAAIADEIRSALR